MAAQHDIPRLFIARITRLFAYGFLSVVLALYLSAIGLEEGRIGLLLTLTLAGDAAVSLWMTTSADRIGRRRMLIFGALLMIGAGTVFVLTQNMILLVLAAIIGVISPSGKEIGPFLSIEQASLAQLVKDRNRTRAFAFYNLAGSFATATGALTAGLLAQGLQTRGLTTLQSYRVVLVGYALAGVVLLICFAGLSPSVEVGQITEGVQRRLGLYRSRRVVRKLSSLFALDAFAGGLIVQSMVAFWFFIRFDLDVGVIGSIFFGANILAGLSALVAVPLAKRFGLINTMVFSHLPSNVLLILVPVMPTLPLAILVLLVRFSISQMDVPTRQSYVMAVVAPDERSAASGVTNIARTLGAAASPVLTGIFLGVPGLLSLPFFLSGSLKIVYDLTLWRQFRSVKPPEET